MKQVQRYAEYRIKEVNGIRQYHDKDQKDPVLGDLIKQVSISAATAKTLNNNSYNFGKVYLLEQPKVSSKVELLDDKLPEQLEVKKLEENSLEKLRQQAKDLGINGAHLMKEETLIKKLKEANV